jgi:hypothetical protein
MLDHSLKGQDCRAWLVSPDRACNVDEPFDLVLADFLVRHHEIGQPTSQRA